MLQAQCACGTDPDTVTAAYAQLPRLRIVAVTAVKAAALEKYGTPVPRAVHTAKRDNPVYQTPFTHD